MGEEALSQSILGGKKERKRAALSYDVCLMINKQTKNRDLLLNRQVSKYVSHFAVRFQKKSLYRKHHLAEVKLYAYDSEYTEKGQGPREHGQSTVNGGSWSMWMLYSNASSQHMEIVGWVSKQDFCPD